MKVPENNPWHQRASVPSQWGEDGIITEIFRRIGTNNRYCVEFGAWDGKTLSNTWNLWHNEGWSALLIEGSPKRCTTLSEEAAPFTQVRTCNAYVSVEGENSLDSLLKRSESPEDLDLLSIDVDSDDYYILASLEQFRPRL